MFRRNSVVLVLLVLALLPTSAPAAGSSKKSMPVGTLTERERALHLLNRLTFGPRPGDVDKVMSMGVERWIEQQLQPDSIPDAGVDARLAAFRTIRMSPKDMANAFPPQGVINLVAQGKAPMPADRNEYGLYEVL